MVTVYECGNGDCFLIEDSQFNLQIDLGDSGNSNLKVSNPISFNYDLMITHGHTDHMIGNAKSLTKAPNKVFVPAYFPEYLCIKNVLEGKNNSVLKGLKYELVYEGIKLYGDYEVLNPSLTPWDNWKIAKSKKLDVDVLNKYLATRNTSYEKILEEISSIKDCYKKPDDSRFDPIKFVESYFKLLIKNQYVDDGENNGIIAPAGISTTQTPAQRLGFFMTYFDKYQANDMSIVFHYKDSKDVDFLFTGDAGLSTWDRLINAKKNISCEVLKVPHHGSKENLNLKVLSQMKPKAAIISHKNQCGKIDKHPNIEIIGYLKFFDIDVYYTNDVIKRGSSWAKATIGQVNGYDITFA